MQPLALLPRQPVPALDVPLVTGGRFILGASPGERFDLLVFYRGLHCPICAKYLIELERLVPTGQRQHGPHRQSADREESHRRSDGVGPAGESQGHDSAHQTERQHQEQHAYGGWGIGGCRRGGSWGREG